MFWPIYRSWQWQFSEGPDGPNRREVLTAALAAAGGLVCFERGQAGECKSGLPRVVVVGAGFAGLACADELAAVEALDVKGAQ